VHEVAEGVIRARIYTPPGEGPFPAVVMLHGGGWWIGGGPAGLEAADGGCRLMCLQLGAVIVNVDYRQAPEDPYPTPHEDCYAATCWTVEHAAELRVDAGRVAVMGPSAGGNLAAAVALLARDRGGPSIRSVMLMVPALDASMSSPSITENGEGYDATATYLARAWELYLGRDTTRTDPIASPLHADLAVFPQTLVVVAEFDPLRDDGIRFVERLRAAGVDASLSRYPMGHSVMTPDVAADYLTDVLSRLDAALSD
jgi:acetyl esterase